MDTKAHLSKSWVVDRTHKPFYTGGVLQYVPGVPTMHEDCDGQLIACLRDGDVSFMCSKEGILIKTLQDEVSF